MGFFQLGRLKILYTTYDMTNHLKTILGSIEVFQINFTQPGKNNWDGCSKGGFHIFHVWITRFHRPETQVIVEFRHLDFWGDATSLLKVKLSGS